MFLPFVLPWFRLIKAKYINPVIQLSPILALHPPSPQTQPSRLIQHVNTSFPTLIKRLKRLHILPARSTSSVSPHILRSPGIKDYTSSSDHSSDSTPYSSSSKQCYFQSPSDALLSGERPLYCRFQGKWALSFHFGRRAGFVGALGIFWGLGGGLRLGLRDRGGGTRCGCRLCPCPKHWLGF